MINAKLKSRRGATLIFALVALAVAVIVCAVVIYAAQSNAGRIRSAQAAEQAQLTLNSAASVVRDQFAGNGIELVNTYTTVTSTTNGVPTVTKNPGTVAVTYKNTDALGRMTLLASGSYVQGGALTLTQGSLTPLRNVLLNWAIDTMTGTAVTRNACYEEYTVKASGPDGSLEDVQVKLRLEPGGTADLATQEEREAHDAEKYYLTAVFSMDSVPSETITMTLMATVQENTSSTLVSKSSHTEQASDGSTVTISRQEVKTEEMLKLSWAEANIVVNVADKDGGIK